MLHNYDKIARYYDVLSRFVFFKSQVNAQVSQLQFIPYNSLILIVGGGTGWILEEITNMHPQGLQIVYVDSSSKMTEISTTRYIGCNTIEYVNSEIEDYRTDLKFDIVLTPFLFGNFEAAHTIPVFEYIHLLLKEKGMWLFTDFNQSQRNIFWWKSIVLRSMYLFFNALEIIKATGLTEITPYFNANNYTIVHRKTYYGTLIEAIVYLK